MLCLSRARAVLVLCYRLGTLLELPSSSLCFPFAFQVNNELLSPARLPSFGSVA